MQVLGGIGNDSSKTVLVTLQLTKIKSRETFKQELQMSTTNQNICIRAVSLFDIT